MPNYKSDNMKRNFTFGLFFSILILLGCNRSKDGFDSSSVNFIKSRVWNLDLPDSIPNTPLHNHMYSLYMDYFKHRSIFFYKNKFCLGSLDGYQDSCVFLHDTLLITQSGYKSSNPGSYLYVTDTLFLGKILHLDIDSLKILRIKDKLFNVLLGNTNFNRVLKYYNDYLITKKETKFKVISISSGYCFGSCPKQAVEIDSLGNLFFYGGGYAFKEGNFKGEINTQLLDSVKHFLSASLINRDVFKLYSTPTDAPGTEMKIILENNDTITVDGEAVSFNFRLWQIYHLLSTRVKTANLERNADIHKFLSTKYIENK